MIFEERGRRLLVVAVDLIQAHGALEQELELVVGISRGEDDVFGLEAPLDYPNAHSLEIFEAEVRRSRGGREAPGIPKHLPCSPLSIKA